MQFNFYQCQFKKKKKKKKASHGGALKTILLLPCMVPCTSHDTLFSLTRWFTKTQTSIWCCCGHQSPAVWHSVKKTSQSKFSRRFPACWTRRQCQPASQLWDFWGKDGKEEEKSLCGQLRRRASERRCFPLGPAVTRLRLIWGGISSAPLWCASITCNHFQSLFPLRSPLSLSSSSPLCLSLCLLSLSRPSQLEPR